MAERLELPILRGVAAQTFTVTLDGRPFTFELDWIGRLGRWVFSLSTASGVSLVRCKGLVLGADLLRQIRYNPLAPQGVLFCQDQLHLDVDPTFENFGDRVKLLYLSLED